MATKGWSLGALVAALKGAAFKDVAAEAEMKIGIGTNVPSVEAVMSLLDKRSFNADFNSASVANSDFIRIPDVDGGLIIQWGLGIIAATSGVITLPTPFPNKFMAVNVTKRSGDARYLSVLSRTPAPLAAFVVYGWSGSAPAGVDTFSWIAIGY